MNEVIEQIKELMERKLTHELPNNHITRVYIGHINDNRQRETIYCVMSDNCSRDYASFVEMKYLRALKEQQDSVNVRVLLNRDSVAVLPKDAQVVWEDMKFYV